jgi:isopentenyl diphosphate isomerase/L-lactate dehydrogenase-like FMN-dependent dehydrogenase
MATGSPRGAAALAGLMTDPSPAAPQMRPEGGGQEIGVGDHPLARAGLGSAGSAEGGVGGANLIQDGGAPARKYDWCIPAEELETLGNVPAMERRALEVLPPAAGLFIGYGAEDQESIRNNKAAWERFNLRPRVAIGRNVARIDTRTTVLGREVSLPVLCGPAGGHGVAHPDGEVAIARAAAAAGTVGGIGQRASFPLSEIHAAAAELAEAPTLFWQLYVPKQKGGDLMDRAYCERVIVYAAACGYHALVVTVDTPVPGNREATYNDPAWALGMREQAGGFPPIKSLDEAGVEANLPGGHCCALTWDDIEWMAGLSAMRLIVKGIMTAEDGARCAACPGVAGVVVSNHGGRQIDGTLGSIEVVPEVVAAVGGRVEVYVDGGVRRGKDVFKALALGATAVFLGRPVFWGLALGGQAGIERVLEILLHELTVCMQLCGAPSVADITPAMVGDRGFAARGAIVEAPWLVGGTVLDGQPGGGGAALLAAKEAEVIGLRAEVAALKQALLAKI